MRRFNTSLLALLLTATLSLFVMVGCSSPTAATPAPVDATPVPATAPTSAEPSATAVPPTVAATQPISATTVSEPTPVPATAAPTSEVSQPAATSDTGSTTPTDMGYLDDRSTAQTLMESFVNALNNREYLRAYGYWDTERAEGLPAFDEFVSGYENTNAVKLVIGGIQSDAGAGNFYSIVPVTLDVLTTAGENEVYVGCYLLHLSSPSAQAMVPFQPLAIQSAYVVQVEVETDVTARMTTICEEGDYPTSAPTPPAPTPNPTDISNQVYVDNRSDAVAVVRSLFNAINSSQYARAYSYWETDAPQLAPFAEFEAGYANTESVELITGEVTGDAGAGQQYYSVPVTLNVTNRDGMAVTYVGCYVLHLASPAAQATAPFRPLAIREGALATLDAGQDAATVMATACQQ